MPLDSRSSLFAAAAAVILLWAALLATGGPLFTPDTAILAAIHAGDRAAATSLATLLTELGGWKVLTALAAAAALWLAARGRGAAALVLIAAVLSGRVAVETAKWLGGRPRPDELDQLVAVHSMSFPSGHAANSGITYAALALLLFPGRPLALWLAALLSLAIGISRIVLGVHWPTDVLGGWAMALLWSLLLHRFVGSAGTGGGPPSLKTHEGETIMSDNDRADTARRNDDSDLIDDMEGAPSFGGASGGNLQRDIASRAEEQHDVDGKPGVTRVQDKDKPEQANLPRFNESN